MLRQINLAHFAWVFLSAYITYELKSRLGIDPLIALFILVPVFAVLGMAVQSLLMRFAITPFNSLLITFGMTVSVEALLQWVWSADFRRMASVYEEHKFRLGGVVITYSEAITLCLSCALVGFVWWMLHRTDMGKSVRASAEDPEIATAFGIHAKRLGIWLAGLCATLAACAGVCVALMFTLAPSQIFSWIGVIFAVVMIGRLGSALTPLVGGLTIGIIESMTMALIAPTWAPLAAFMVLILILLFRRGHE